MGFKEYGPHHRITKIFITFKIDAGAEVKGRQNVRIGGFKGVLLSTLMVASIIALAMPLLSPSPVHAALTPHAPIYIDGNAGFTAPDPVNGGGSGTENDPYIIENWDTYVIWIVNTDAYFIIRNCHVHGAQGDGIVLDRVTNGKIENVVTFANDGGIYLHDSGNNIISNCAFYNYSWGIYLYHSSYNTIANSTIARNWYGIQLWNGSDNNRIYHNNLLNNENQAYDDGLNYWDNGYPSGGNYWSDYTGVDENQGENQDIPGSDNIGDTPYYIPDGQNRDRYPSMNPFPIPTFRAVTVWISPWSRDGPPKAPLTYTITVNNVGTENDNFDLSISDNTIPSWSPTLSEYLLEVPAGENRQTTLSVTIPENAVPCTKDEITVIATSRVDNTAKASASCIAHAIAPKADFSLVTIYKLGLDMNLYLENGSKLVVKFYDYENIFENENVIHVFTPPWHIEENEIVERPRWLPCGVKKAKLWLVDNLDNEISKIKGWVTIRDDLWKRLLGIRAEWPYADPPTRDNLWKELLCIRSQWPYAPSTRDPVWIED